MKLEIAKQAAVTESASFGATVRTGRTKSETDAGARAARQSSVEPAALPTGQEKNQKKTKRAASVATPVGETASEKLKKTKVVRDSFTVPEADYRMLAEIKRRCLTDGKKAERSEFLRVGVNLLVAIPTSRLLTVVAKLESVKTGQSAKD